MCFDWPLIGFIAGMFFMGVGVGGTIAYVFPEKEKNNG